MLEIKPCLEMPVIAAYCRKCGELPGPDLYAYLAANRGETLAAGLFQIASDEVRVLHYEGDEGDVFLFDGILRAGINYAAEQGIPWALIPGEFRARHREVFGQLQYPIETRFDISNFFAKYKSCAGRSL